MAIASTFLYGSGTLYGPSSGSDIPVDLRFYRTNVDGVYVFHWGFEEAFVSPILSTLDFDLQIDTTITFNSPNLQVFNSTTAIDFQNGDVRKGFAVPVKARLDGQEQVFFARVRSVLGASFSDWSLPIQFTIFEKFQQESAENLLGNLPDRHVYGKEDLKKAVSARTTKLYKVCDMYGAEFDQSFLELKLIGTNLTIELCRDENLFDNFGTLFDYQKPQSQEFVEYRECLRSLILGSLVGGTIDAIQRVVKCATGVSPNILLVRDRKDFYLSTIFETPPEATDGVTTFFSTSSDYIVGSLVVLQNGSVLTPGVDFTENHATPGFDMTVAPTGGDTLQVFFDIGSPGDPDPVVFDISSGSTLTGTVTFTNGSKNVTGAGTAFTTELQERRIITDDGGLVLGLVDTIIDDNNLILEDAWTGDTGASVAAKVIDFNGTFHIRGDVTFTNGSTTVTGVSSFFDLDIKPGDTITDNSGTVFGVVDTITDANNLELTSAWTGSTGSNENARKLIYSDNVLWDQGSLAHGLVIQILNPGEFSLDEEMIIEHVKKVLPAHVKVFFEFL